MNCVMGCLRQRSCHPYSVKAKLPKLHFHFAWLKGCILPLINHKESVHVCRRRVGSTTRVQHHGEKDFLYFFLTQTKRAAITLKAIAFGWKKINKHMHTHKLSFNASCGFPYPNPSLYQYGRRTKLVLYCS